MSNQFGFNGSERRPTTRIILVDPNPSLRRVLADVLSLQEGWEVCGEAGRADAAVRLLRRERPDIAVVDPSLPDSVPTTTIARLAQEAPHMPILVYSWLREHSPSRGEYRANGASAVVDKRDDIWTLVSSVARLATSIPVAASGG